MAINPFCPSNLGYSLEYYLSYIVEVVVSYISPDLKNNNIISYEVVELFYSLIILFILFIRNLFLRQVFWHNLNGFWLEVRKKKKKKE